MSQNLAFKEEPLDEEKLINIVDSIESIGDDKLVFEAPKNPTTKNILPMFNIPEPTIETSQKDNIIDNNKKQLQEIKIETEKLTNETNKMATEPIPDNIEPKKEEKQPEKNEMIPSSEDVIEQEEEEEEKEEEEEESEEDKQEEEEDDESDDEEKYNKIEQTNNQSEMLLDYHPEVKQLSYNEVKSLSKISRDNNNNIIDPLHTTIPILTKYEKARILGVRAKQLDNGADSFIPLPSNVIDSYTIAEMELYEKRLPFIIRRPMPSGGSEYWPLKELEIIDL
jgi:DNA-directed RNA polymerase I, II, and III subunit RPABC2